MHSPRSLGALFALCILLLTQQVASQTLVFAHYMVGTITQSHARQDIDDAAAMGLDGFALNIGDPTQLFVRQALNYMFDYTRDKYPKFKLFFSLDLSTSGGAGKKLGDYDSLLRDFMGHGAYQKGANGFPFVSTFGDGGTNKEAWLNWKKKWANKVYLVPDFDQTQGDTTMPTLAGGDTGVIWLMGCSVGNPLGRRSARGTLTTAPLTRPLLAVLGSGRSLTCLYGARLWRAGEKLLTQRMKSILAMSPAPEYVEILTWNDGH